MTAASGIRHIESEVRRIIPRAWAPALEVAGPPAVSGRCRVVLRGHTGAPLVVRRVNQRHKDGEQNRG